MQKDADFQQMVNNAQVIPFEATNWESLSKEEQRERCEEFVKSMVEQISSMQTKADEKIANAMTRLNADISSVGKKMRTVQGVEHVYKMIVSINDSADDSVVLADAAKIAVDFAARADEFSEEIRLSSIDEMEDIVEELYDHEFASSFIDAYHRLDTTLIESYIHELLNIDLARMAGSAVNDIVAFRNAAEKDVQKVADNLKDVIDKCPDLWPLLPHDDESFPKIPCPVSEA